jgi:trk system potassium uptake protein TrkH
MAHVLSAVSTGGFSTYDDSLAGFGSSAAASLFALLSFLGAISLPLYYLTFMRGWRPLAEDVELPALAVGVLLAAAVLTGLLVAAGRPGGEAAYQGLMTGVFAQTTTGFSTLPIAQLGAGAKAAILLAMGIGGCIGSTAGGLKILRFLIVLRLLGLSIRRTATPSHAIVKTWLGERRLASDDIQRSLVVVLLFGLTVFCSWLPFVVAGYNPLDALFEVVSATGTVGLTTGLSQSGLPAILKGILCLDMLAGRLEFIALLVVLYPGTWLGKRMEV